MSVLLKKMQQEEYQNYISIAIPDYAKEKVTAGTWKESESLKLATENFQRYLPDGEKTKDEFLYTIQETSLKENIGFIWVHLTEEKSDSKFFIYDFIIFERFRNRGFGRKTLTMLEKEAKKRHVKQIDLHVFAHNKTAVHLYQDVGFIETDINMTKKLH